MVTEVEESIQIIKWYYGGNSMRTVIKLYTEKYPDKPKIAVGTIGRIIRNFNATGCVSPRYHHHSGSCSKVLSAERKQKELMILNLVKENPTISTRKIGQEVNLSAKKIQIILREHGYFYTHGTTGEKSKQKAEWKQEVGWTRNPEIETQIEKDPNQSHELLYSEIKQEELMIITKIEN